MAEVQMGLAGGLTEMWRRFGWDWQMETISAASRSPQASIPAYVWKRELALEATSRNSLGSSTCPAGSPIVSSVQV